MAYRLHWITSRYQTSFHSGLRQKEVSHINLYPGFKSIRTSSQLVNKGGVLPRAEKFQSILQNHLQQSYAVSPNQKFKKASCPSLHQPRRITAVLPSTTKTPLNGQEHWIEYTIKPGDTLWALAVKKFHVHVKDLIRDNNVQDPRKLMPGDKIKIRLSSYPEEQEVVASWYGGDFHGKPMANGEPYNMYAATIAHRTLPLGTEVELQNSNTGKKVKAVVTDRGPFVDGRDVDLSYRLAQRLSLVKKGVDRLVMRVIG